MPNSQAAPAPNRLVALLWTSVFLALLLAVCAMRGFAPMPYWGSAEVNLKFSADGKSVIGVAAQTASRNGQEAGRPLVGVDTLARTITLKGAGGAATTYMLDPGAAITLDGFAVSLSALPIGSWAAEFKANSTEIVMRSVAAVAVAVAGAFALAAVLAKRNRSTRSVMWMRHLLIGGYVLIGLYLYGGVRIINLIWEKKLMVPIAAANASAAINAPPAAPTAPPPTTAPAATAPTTRKAKAPAVAAPSPTPGVSVPTPTMRTNGIDLDAPATKPAAPVTPEAPRVPPPIVEAAPATQPAPPVQTASATTQPATQPTTKTASVDPLAPTPEAAADEPPEPEFIANQYQLYWRSNWNRVGAFAVFALAALVVIVHVGAWQLARQTRYVAGGAHSSLGTQDVAYHSNLDSSIVIHVLIILIIPLLLQLHWPNHWIKFALDFSTPGGGGSEPVQVKVQKKKPQKKIPKYVLQKNSSISFFVPKMDDSVVQRNMDDQTQNQYVATAGTGHGKGRGRGKGNGRGSGWGNGTGKVRFYHLHYSGDNTNWEDGFTDGKDSNLLTEWQARERKEGSDLPFGDAVVLTPSQLRPDSHGLIAPFIFITGNANAMSVHETEQVRQYIQKGGMIFADPQYNWQASFLAWAKRLFPGQNLLPIDNRQDPIFDGRYPFPGPPAFWSGNKSFLGIKHEDRWVFICDRGRMADGWKNPINEDCVRMGINIIDYAHDHYANKPN